MFETITNFAGYLETVSFFTYPVAALLGLLAGVTALTCLAPLVPAVAGFVVGRGDRQKRGVSVPLMMTLGSVVTLVALGVAVSAAGLTLQRSLGRYWPYVIGAVCVIVGLFTVGLIRIPTAVSIPTIRRGGVLGSFLFGLCAGGVIGLGSSCCMPALPVVLTYAAIQGRPLHGALIMSSFAIGQSVPLFAIGLFGNLLGRLAGKSLPHVRRVAGIVLLVTGIYFIWRG